MMLPYFVQHVLKLHELVQELMHSVLLILERASQQDLLELLALVLLHVQLVVMAQLLQVLELQLEQVLQQALLVQQQVLRVQPVQPFAQTLEQEVFQHEVHSVLVLNQIHQVRV
jgi:hypothetical protein